MHILDRQVKKQKNTNYKIQVRKEKGAMSKVKIAYSYKGDMSIIQQQIEESIKKAIDQLENSAEYKSNPNLKQLKPIIERRLQQFFMNVISKFRSMVEYSKSHEKDIQKVVMDPDQNLQKINEVKTSILKQLLIKSERKKWTQVQCKINVEQPQNINIVHFEGFQQNIHNFIQKKQQKLIDTTQQQKRIRNLQNLITNSITKLQIQQKYDGQLLNIK